jgi:hypothetical protein
MRVGATCTVLLMLLLDHSSAYGLKKLLCKVDQSFVRESEFKHARVALLAAPTLALLGATGVEEPTAWLSSQPYDVQTTFFAVAGLVETTSIARLGPRFSLKPDLVPGNYFSNRSVDATVELTAGRAAMLAAAGLLATGVAA